VHCLGARGLRSVGWSLGVDAAGASVGVEQLKLFVGGQWTEGSTGEHHEVISPVTGEHLANLPRAGGQDVARALEAARRGQAELAAMSTWERAALCHRIGEAIADHREELARIQTLEQGKPYARESLPDIDEAADNFHTDAEDIKRMMSDVVPSKQRFKKIFTLRRPVGTWVAISPWNFPVLTAVEQISPAIATGNAVISKPPENTPWAMLRVAELCAEAGLPTGVLSVIPGDAEVGRALVTSDADGITFIGSSQAGRWIVANAGLKRTIMEMSGNGPQIVLADADLERAARAAVYGASFGSGQVCCATERLIVERAVHDDMRDALLAAAADMVVLGDPFDEATSMGPLNNEPVAAKMDRHLEDARAQGAEILVGGARATGWPTPLYYDFTIVDSVTEKMLLAQEESFGPVVPIIAAEDVDDAVGIANRDKLGLQAALFTTDLRKAFSVTERLKNGSVIVNDTTDYWQPFQPFGGGGGTESGWGKGATHEYTDVQSMVVDYRA
jgi:acyl-CoA reductase-like NAD-dependent aldehyde dehydrogenase